VTVFVTDVDLFTASTEGVLAFLDAPHRAALVSLRRLREAFWRRKADPARQRARLVKEILRATGRVSGLPECNDALCVVSPGDTLADLDRMSEAFCASCWKRLASGTVRP
jgi:predicted Zn-dependent protease